MEDLNLPPDQRAALFEYFLRLADDRLILGHRLSEWCGHGPTLEEDIALANLALDYLGQATFCYRLASSHDTQKRSEDALAFLRSEREFRNVLLLEKPRGDFAFSILRVLLFSAFSCVQLAALEKCTYPPLSAFGAKARKESLYHFKYSAEWVKRLGDGTVESHQRAQRAVDNALPFFGEFLESDEIDLLLSTTAGVATPQALGQEVRDSIAAVLKEATLALPALSSHWKAAGRKGLHSEDLGHLLAVMQSLPRSFPGAEW